MEYCVGRGVIGPWPFVDISAEDFRQLKAATQGISVLLGIEEKFDMVVENYLDFERELLGLALGHMATREHTWAGFREASSLVNRRLANCLTVSRLYTDQTKHDLTRVYGQSAEVIDQIDQALRTQYDRLLGYRVMEVLRNALQHRSLPVTRFDYVSAWKDGKSAKLLHHRVSAQLTVEALQDDKKIKRSVIDELKQRHEGGHDIALFLRQYIEGLSCVHKVLRRATDGDIDPWRGTLLAMIERYSAACGEQVTSAVAFAVDDEVTTDEIQLFREGIDRLQALRNRDVPTTISQSYVSDEHQ